MAHKKGKRKSDRKRRMKQKIRRNGRPSVQKKKGDS